MLPVVRGDRETARQILLYTLVLIGVSSTPLLWAGSARSIGRGARAWRVFLAGGRLLRSPSRRHAGLLFHYSLLYLALLFVAMALDPVLA